MIAKRDHRVWAVAKGEAVADRIDDSDSGELPPVESALKGPVHAQSPDEALKSFTLAPGFEINLFASEVAFPELKKPVAMAFDTRGRLWVTTMPSYPMYLPGQPVNDKILILEDEKGLGKASKASVFADGLYLPTGIALGDGGVYVGCQPNVWFLKDTKGTDKADDRERILMGFGNADAHRAVMNFRWGPDGGLYFNEGVYNYAQVETAYGMRQNFHGGIYRYEPKTGKLDLHVNYRFGNPWGHVFDRWGQEFVSDAADGASYFATAISGQVRYPKKHERMMKEIHAKEHRPTCGSVIVSSRHFPDEWQGDYLINNTMGLQGIVRYQFSDEVSGFSATAAAPLLQSSDPNFRPVDIQFGPDGALYICDWYNPIIGYIDHSLRDPNRDKTRGRIWRITCKDRPLVRKPHITGASIPELLNLLKTPEEYTREQARRELRLRDTTEVTTALKTWIEGLDANGKDFQHNLLEALWMFQNHTVVNESLLKRLLRSPEPRARAAATRVLWFWRDRLDNSLALLRGQAKDEHPRVRLEVIRALSFYDNREARDLAVEAGSDEEDYYLKYALEATLATIDERLKP
jgi:glucose/arabinose dehydrogenase